MAWDSLLAGKKHIVFLGEAGCGKSELSLSCAYALSQLGQTVSLFDLDQTKPLLRTREHAAMLAASGIQLCCAPQLADTPTMAAGLREALSGKNTQILDVGGGIAGARLIAGLSPLLQGEDTAVFFVFNPYRPFGDHPQALLQSMKAISQAARLSSFQTLVNPTLGEDTDSEVFLSGLSRAMTLLPPDHPPIAAAVSETLLPQIINRTSLPLLPLRPLLCYPWLTD